MVGRQCHIVAFEGRASFPLWARPGEPTAPRHRRNAQGQILLERGICSYSQVLNFWYDAVREAIQQAGAIAWDQIPPAGENPREYARSGEPADRPVVYWSYYAQNQWRRAVRDISRRATGSGAANQPSSPKGPDYSSSRCLVLLGFSNGGDAVYQTAKAVRRHGIRVDLAITVDPVRKPLRGMGLMGFRRPDNVARWINYYQRFDRRTLAGLLPIVGRHVDGADENHRLGPEDFPDPKTRPKAHLWIPSLELVRRRITEELTALLSGAKVG